MLRKTFLLLYLLLLSNSFIPSAMAARELLRVGRIHHDRPMAAPIIRHRPVCRNPAYCRGIPAFRAPPPPRAPPAP